MTTDVRENIAVLGGGTWGATLAHHLARKGHDVSIWEFVTSVAERLEKERTLTTLPGFKLHDGVKVSNNMGEALKGKNIILSVTPSHTVRSTFETAAAEKL